MSQCFFECFWCLFASLCPLVVLLPFALLFFPLITIKSTLGTHFSTFIRVPRYLYKLRAPGQKLTPKKEGSISINFWLILILKVRLWRVSRDNAKKQGLWVGKHLGIGKIIFKIFLPIWAPIWWTITGTLYIPGYTRIRRKIPQSWFLFRLLLKIIEKIRKASSFILLWSIHIYIFN